MTLSFSQKINDAATFFPEKILSGLRGMELTQEMANYLSQSSSHSKPLSFRPKLHTIREDTKDRWKVGAKIHMVINNRTKDRLQFAPVLEVKAIQKIKIWRSVEGNSTKVCVFIDDKLLGVATFLDGYLLSYSKSLLELAYNDGFDYLSPDPAPWDLGFFNWFSEDFEGKIIHWTDLKY
tara:strand:+ start:4591 stop:5127 length:537 start_codon:yes stop_codon:yes gene_type:complete